MKTNRYSPNLRIYVEKIYYVPSVRDSGERTFHADIPGMSSERVEDEIQDVRYSLKFNNNFTDRLWLENRLKRLRHKKNSHMKSG